MNIVNLGAAGALFDVDVFQFAIFQFLCKKPLAMIVYYFIACSIFYFYQNSTMLCDASAKKRILVDFFVTNAKKSILIIFKLCGEDQITTADIGTYK